MTSNTKYTLFMDSRPKTPKVPPPQKSKIPTPRKIGKSGVKRINTMENQIFLTFLGSQYSRKSICFSFLGIIQNKIRPNFGGWGARVGAQGQNERCFYEEKSAFSDFYSVRGSTKSIPLWCDFGATTPGGADVLWDNH